MPIASSSLRRIGHSVHTTVIGPIGRFHDAVHQSRYQIVRRRNKLIEDVHSTRVAAEPKDYGNYYATIDRHSGLQ